MNKYINTLIVCISAVVCVTIFSGHLVVLKTAQNNYLTVTGSATKSFTSDLIVWRGEFSQKAQTLNDAFEKLQKDTFAVKEYLLEKTVAESEIVFSSIGIRENYEYEYNDIGRITKTIFAGYTLTQNVTINSSHVDKIEQISRDITDLIDEGVVFFSLPPEYYYTRLDELRMDLIAESAENTRLRAETLAQKSGGRISKLRSANLGVFQITAENSSAEAYSSVGAFNVSSKNKTAFITTRLEYLLK